jgi:hypothetical protein
MQAVHIFYTLIADFQIGNPGSIPLGKPKGGSARPTVARMLLPVCIFSRSDQNKRAGCVSLRAHELRRTYARRGSPFKGSVHGEPRALLVNGGRGAFGLSPHIDVARHRINTPHPVNFAACKSFRTFVRVQFRRWPRPGSSGRPRYSGLGGATRPTEVDRRLWGKHEAGPAPARLDR